MLSKQYGAGVDNLEKWNDGKILGWAKRAMIEYSICISDGSSPLPPYRKGSDCGPVVPDTVLPTDLPHRSISILALFRHVVAIEGSVGCFWSLRHACTAGGGTGGELRVLESTRVSNYNTQIKRRGVTLEKFYRSHSLERKYLWSKPENTNKDGS